MEKEGLSAGGQKTAPRTTLDSLREGRLKIDAGGKKKKRKLLLNLIKNKYA
jgi:hypothetical protein